MNDVGWNSRKLCSLTSLDKFTHFTEIYNKLGPVKAAIRNKLEFLLANASNSFCYRKFARQHNLAAIVLQCAHVQYRWHWIVINNERLHFFKSIGSV